MAKHLAGDRREAMCAWLTANGINPNDVPQDAEMTISEGTAGRFLNCDVFERTPDGHIQVDERGEKAAVTVIHVPLKVEPPEWWEPYEKPTRDELLRILERVRAAADAGPPSGTAIPGEWEGGWDSAMESVRDALDGKNLT